MNEETTRPYDEVEGKPYYDNFLPDAIQVLVEWILLIISTLTSFFKAKDAE